MAAESARIALRCEEAKNTSKLDLEECGLRKFPDAIYFLLKNVMLHTVSIAHNDLTVLPKKFGLQLVTITSELQYCLCVLRSVHKDDKVSTDC